jgi:putative transposase
LTLLAKLSIIGKQGTVPLLPHIGGVFMARLARQKSESGVYHIILRGINRQVIFHDEEDRLYFLRTVNRYKRKVNLKVHGWCLMNNHIHLLLGEGDEDISTSMKRMGVSIAWFYHGKYKTVGHFLQDRFKSEAVEDDSYLLTVIRYIHQNPVKAGIVEKPAEWKWSSCQRYYGETTYPPELLDSGLILNLFSTDNKEEAIKMFHAFNEFNNEDICLEDALGARLTDAESKAEIIKAIPEIEIGMIKNLPKLQRDRILARIKQIEGVSQRQAGRILDISTNIVFKA